MPMPISDGTGGKLPMEYNANPDQYRFNSDIRSERGYWLMRKERATALTQELHLTREIAKMDKKELELIIETPKRMPELEFIADGDYYCYKCKRKDHWASQCPNTKY
jgi:hypothetical protein